jgi:hypothetical protein
VATLLYTALVPLKVYSVIEDWLCPAGSTVPLNPLKPSTIRLLAEGKIVLADPGATDTTTPPHTLRGVPGLRVGVSN